MRFRFLTLGSICVALLTAGCGESAEPHDPERAAELRTVASKLKPLHKTLGKPQPGDWLASHKEAGQTFAEYLKADPVTPTVIYVQPLGPFTEKQQEIVELSADYLGRYFNRPVKIKKNLPISIIPPKARRKHPTWV